jgi:hypothetical protein
MQVNRKARRAFLPSASVCRKEHPMMDLVMLAIGLSFFALSVGYAVACDRL